MKEGTPIFKNHQLSEKQRFWNHESRHWKYHDGLFGGAEMMIFKEIKDHVDLVLPQLPERAKILNLGAGANNKSFLNSQRKDLQVIALDFSPNMLRLNEAEKKIMADVSSPLPILNESIDFCFSSFLIRYLSTEDYVLLFKEIWRVLKNNNRFVIADLNQNKFPHQESKFNSEALKIIAEKIGFCKIKKSGLNRSFTERIGGYNTGMTYDINLGIITGKKP